MIFGTWRRYFISWQIFENKVWCPVSKKIRRYFHFLLSLAYPIDRLDWALFSVVILFYHWFPLLEKAEIRAFILPRNFPAVLIIFTGRGGKPPLPGGIHPWWKTLDFWSMLSFWEGRGRGGGWGLASPSCFGHYLIAELPSKWYNNTWWQGISGLFTMTSNYISSESILFWPGHMMSYDESQ